MQRNQSLLEKVQQINETFTQKYNKPQNIDGLNNKLGTLKKKMENMMMKNTQELQKIKSASIQLLNESQEQNAKYEKQAQIQMEELKIIYEQMSKKIQMQIVKRKSKQHQLLSSFDKKIELLRNQIQKEKKVREDLFAQVTQTLQDDVPQLMDELLQGKQEFQKSAQETVQQIRQVFEESHEVLDQFVEGQKENEAKAYNLIRDLTQKAKSQIQQQQYICEATHEQVLNYVEQTCNRLNQPIL